MTRFRLNLVLTLIVALALGSISAPQLRGQDQASPHPASTMSKPVAQASDELMRDATSVTRPVSTARHQWMEVTAYCPCTHCCGPNAAGVTASGLPVSHNQGRFVAADTSILPFGSRVSIPGYHEATSVPVIDRGGAIRGHRIDVFFPTHDEALQWGRQWVLVSIDTPVEHADAE